MSEKQKKFIAAVQEEIVTSHYIAETEEVYCSCFRAEFIFTGCFQLDQLHSLAGQLHYIGGRCSWQGGVGVGGLSRFIGEIAL